MTHPALTATTIRAVPSRQTTAHENPFESPEERGIPYDDLRDIQGAYVPVLTVNTNENGGMGGQAYRSGTSGLYSGAPDGRPSFSTADSVSPQLLPSPPPKDDLYDERLGVVDKARPKFSKTQTSQAYPTTRSAVQPGRVRRSMSHDSASVSAITGITGSLNNIKLLPVKEKVGSKHADVIDLWDGTGLGKSMWHHSGPYDAAAPSRNLHTPPTKAPMHAFIPPTNEPQSAPPSGTDSRGTSTDSLSVSAPGHQGNFDRSRGHDGLGGSSSKLSQRAQYALRQGRNATSPGISGLSAQYSSSMPNSGGYFAVDARGDGDEDMTERRQREKERELKRKAMQAAWGVDAPEPYEEFGYTATTPTQEDAVELGDEALPLPTPATSRPLRSPGLRMARHSSYVTETEVAPSSQDYFGTSPDGGAARSPGGGLKRTKSLMQKIKAMRENPNIPLGVGGRGASPSRQGQDEFAIQRTSNSSPTDDSGSASTQGGSATNVLPPPAPKAQRNPFLHRRRPSRQGLTPPLPDSPEVNEETLNALEPWEEQLNYATATTAAVPSATRTRSTSTSGLGDGFASLVKTRSRSKAGNREKGLPPPPAQPVMPDFADLHASGAAAGGGAETGRIRFESNEKGDSEGFSGDSGLRRKTSLVKKLKDRMTR